METCKRSSGSRGPAGTAGFSVTELLVVVAIIVILVAVMAPNIGQYIRNYKIRGVANEISTNIQKARNRAIMKNAQLGVTVVVQDPRTYWVHVEDDQTPPRTLLAREPLDMGNAPTPAQAAQSTRFRLTSETVRFATTAAECPTAPGGAFVPAAYGLRFSRLGAWCQPGATATCPDVTVTNGARLNVVHATGGGGALLCVTEPTSGLSRWISVTTGGRVSAQP